MEINTLLKEFSLEMNKVDTISKNIIIQQKLKKIKFEIENLKNNLIHSKKENLALKNTLEKLMQNRPHMKIENFASQVRDSFEKLNKEAKSGKSQFFIENVDFEIKGGFYLKGGISLIQMLPHELTPECHHRCKSTHFSPI